MILAKCFAPTKTYKSLNLALMGFKGTYKDLSLGNRPSNKNYNSNS